MLPSNGTREVMITTWEVHEVLAVQLVSLCEDTAAAAGMWTAGSGNMNDKRLLVWFQERFEVNINNLAS